MSASCTKRFFNDIVSGFHNVVFVYALQRKGDLRYETASDIYCDYGNGIGVCFGTGAFQGSVSVNAAPVPLEADPTPRAASNGSFDYGQIPAYSGTASVAVNNNRPFFTDAERGAWGAGTEYYSAMDALGRCEVAYACVGRRFTAVCHFPHHHSCSTL